MAKYNEDSSDRKRTINAFGVVAAAVCTVVGGLLLFDSFASIDTNEVACFRTFGHTDCNGKVPVMAKGKPLVIDGNQPKAYRFANG